MLLRHLCLYTRKENVKQKSMKVICLFVATQLAFTVFWLLVLSLVSQTVKSLNWGLSRGKCG